MASQPFILSLIGLCMPRGERKKKGGMESEATCFDRSRERNHSPERKER